MRFNKDFSIYYHNTYHLYSFGDSICFQGFGLFHFLFLREATNTLSQSFNSAENPGIQEKEPDKEAPEHKTSDSMKYSCHSWTPETPICNICQVV